MADMTKLIGIGLVGVVGYLAYKKYRGGTLLSPAPPMFPPISSGPPGMTPPFNTGTVPPACSVSSSTLQQKALSWVHGSDRSYQSLVNFFGGYPMDCRAMLGSQLIAAGASASAVRTALAAVGIRS